MRYTTLVLYEWSNFFHVLLITKLVICILNRIYRFRFRFRRLGLAIVYPKTCLSRRDITNDG